MLTLPFAFDQSEVAQQPELVGHRGLLHVYAVSQLAHGRRAAAQPAQDEQPAGRGQRLHRGGNGLGGAGIEIGGRLVVTLGSVSHASSLTVLGLYEHVFMCIQFGGCWASTVTTTTTFTTSTSHGSPRPQGSAPSASAWWCSWPPQPCRRCWSGSPGRSRCWPTPCTTSPTRSPRSRCGSRSCSGGARPREHSPTATPEPRTCRDFSSWGPSPPRPRWRATSRW